MTTTEPPEELKRQLPHDPRLWARNFLRHPNDPSRPYDFYTDDEDQFLYYLTDDEGPMNPAQWGDINIFLFARGCLKTFTVSTIAAWGLDSYPSLEAVVSAPVDDQREEVIDRFRIKAEQSGLLDRAEQNSMRHMKFRNTTVDPQSGREYTTYSHLKSRTAWGGGDKLRGLHAHLGVLDESQDVDEGTFSTFLETIDRGVPQVDYFPTIFIIGTPKMANTFFNRLWEMSDQQSWDNDDKEWVQQSESDVFLPPELSQTQTELEERIQELKEERYTASERGNGQRVEELTEMIDTFNDELSDIEGFTVRGWHVDQYNSPLHREKDIAFKRETYSTRKFKNEVEATFYSPDNDLITTEDVWNTAFVDEGWQPTPRYDDTLTVLGCDWGGGKGEGAARTVIGVAEVTPDGERMALLNMHICDPDLSHAEERERIDEWMTKYDVDIGVVDEGHGDTDREELQDEYGYNDGAQQSIYGCWYGNVKDKEEIKWNRFNNQRRFFTASKTYCVKKMAEDFKNGQIRIPQHDLSFDSKRSDGTRVVEQLSAPYTERDETRTGSTRTRVVSDGDDDVFDMVTYCWIAANMVPTRRVNRTPKSHTRPGYE